MTDSPHHRRFWTTPPMWMALPVAAILALGLGVGGYVLAQQGQSAVADKESVGREAVQQAVTIESLCGRGDDVSRALEEAGQCDQAQVVQREAERVGAVPSAAAAPAVVDSGELLSYVRTAVADYCSGTAACRPDTAVLVEIVADFLTANPPEPGRAPTQAEITTAARTVLTEDPDLFRGEPGTDGVNGENGAPGPGPSDEQVLAQVATFCADGRCRGDQGPQGPGISAFYFERSTGGQCEAVVVFVNPATGEEITDRRAAGDAACPPAPEPPVETPLPIPE